MGAFLNGQARICAALLRKYGPQGADEVPKGRPCGIAKLIGASSANLRNA
jgi:hypothetical protein